MPPSALSAEFALSAPRLVPGPAGRRAHGRLYTWDVLFREEKLGVYFLADRHDDGEIHRISLRTSRAILPYYKSLNVPKHWLDLDYVDGGPGWEWAAPDLKDGIVPRGWSEQEPLLVFLARRFVRTVASMEKTDGLPSMEGWSAPLVAAVLVEKGWPISVPSAQAWLDAHQAWANHVQSRPPAPKEIHEGDGGQRWAIGANGRQRLCFNFECVAFPEREWLTESTLFGKGFLDICRRALQQDVVRPPGAPGSLRVGP